MIVDSDENRKLIDDFFALIYDLRLNADDVNKVFDFVNTLHQKPASCHCPVTGVTDQGFNQ